METGYDKLMHIVGESVVDAGGDRIGKVAQVVCQPNSVTPEWLVVRTSRFGRPRLVPLDDAERHGDAIRVPFAKETVLHAPVPEIIDIPASGERMALLRHYYRKVA